MKCHLKEIWINSHTKLIYAQKEMREKGFAGTNVHVIGGSRGKGEYGGCNPPPPLNFQKKKE